ncbi:hypothetical protein JCM14202_28 [Agrilactobacillus composti DSM 18527 = JCM 14202]|nr:hypothetical protein JCM14202_28 [Agrilactobacillus composti DSM 18527 = JCM 14202]
MNVQAEMKTDFDYQLLGYVTPKKIGYKIPVFNNLVNPSNAALMNLGAQLNTGGNVPMYHIVGVTPEAETITAAFQGHEVKETVTITQADLDEMRSDLTAPYGKIEFALFGCPHLTLDQIKIVADLVENQHLKVPLFIMSSAPTQQLCQDMGYLQTIEAAGGEIISNTCMDQPCWKFLYGKKGVTDSPKCAYYTKRRNMEFVITELENAVKAALKGEIYDENHEKSVSMSQNI